MNTNRKAYNKVAKEWHKSRRSKQIDQCIVDFSAMLKPQSKILDIGCGTGFPIDKYLCEKGFSVTGIDISENMLEIAKSQNLENANFQLCDFFEFEPLEKYDAIIAFDSLFHLPKEKQAEIYNRLSMWSNQEAYILFTHGKRNSEVSGNMFNENFYYSSLDTKEVHELLLLNGFEIVQSTENYKDEVSGERDLLIIAKKSKNNTLFIGDSIIAGTGSIDDNRSGKVLPSFDKKEIFKEQLGKRNFVSQLITDLNNRFQNINIHHHGYSGTNSTFIREYICSSEIHYDLIFLCTGMNNRKILDGISTLEKDLQSIISYCNSNNIKLILFTYPPVSMTDDNQPNRVFKSTNVNEMIVNISKANNIELIDLYSLVLVEYEKQNIDINNYSVEEYDGLHPNQEMHDIIYRTISHLVTEKHQALIGN